MKPGDQLTLTIERPAAGGRMIARQEGAIVLVSACIPGETVTARVEKVQRGTAWARTVSVEAPSADRIEPGYAWSCGGAVFAHIRYARQLAIKQDIIRDAFTRIGRMTLPGTLPITPSPTEGYRMRARLHVQRGRVGFFHEGTHRWCEPAATRQLLPATLDTLSSLDAVLRTWPGPDVLEVELAENMPATDRALHFDLGVDADPSRLGSLPAIAGVSGISCGSAARSPRSLTLAGSPFVTDRLSVPAAAGPVGLTLRRHAHSFFQGNRFLVEALCAAVIDAVPDGRVLDLYAGVGLFAVALASRGRCEVLAVEGDRRAADDLKTNTGTGTGQAAGRHQAVEVFLATEHLAAVDTVIVDPPRTGLSKDAMAGVLALRAPLIVYVSCDVATLARDARRLADSGYRLTRLHAFDLFPNTAHVETLVVFER